MRIIVCIKRVPRTSDSEISIDSSGKDIEKGKLLFDLNEWDLYALEEAVQLKEKYGGTVTVISMGKEDVSESLRKCLAMGADEAVRLGDPTFEEADGFATARVLARAVQKFPFDLILTGAQAEDDGYGMVGVAMARLLNIPHASLVTKIDVQGKKLTIQRELEGGLEEVCEIDLPALLTVQTGINEPRYVSILGIRMAVKKEIRTMCASDLGIKPVEAGILGSHIRIDDLHFPSISEPGQILEGNPQDLSARIIEIIREKGGIAL